MKNAGEYKWSSYRHYAYGEKDSLLDEDPYYKGLGREKEERQKHYREYVRLEGPYEKVIDTVLLEQFF